jgi:undecaprenyl diphosphate synthase
VGLSENVPGHVAIIMDGNGRWAKARGLPRMMGHRAGSENLRRIIRACVDLGIPILTIYAFSTENWARPKEEVQGLLRLLENMIDRELAGLNKEGVQIRHIGRRDELSPALRRKLDHAIEVTRENQKLILCIAWNYGGRDEITCAVKRIIESGATSADVNEDLIQRHLFTAGLPDPDLIIRTSGEMRTSNFLIWQAAYSEWYVTPVLWPDFNKEELIKALNAYKKRDRRFGRLSRKAEEHAG